MSTQPPQPQDLVNPQIFRPLFQVLRLLLTTEWDRISSLTPYDIYASGKKQQISAVLDRLEHFAIKTAGLVAASQENSLDMRILQDEIEVLKEDHKQEHDKMWARIHSLEAQVHVMRGR